MSTVRITEKSTATSSSRSQTSCCSTAEKLRCVRKHYHFLRIKRGACRAQPPYQSRGHTDNVPIRTAQFPSNWDLSAARAVMVVRVLSELYSVPSDHLAAVGHADTRPVTGNLDSEQRAKIVELKLLFLSKRHPLHFSGQNMRRMALSNQRMICQQAHRSCNRSCPE